MKKNVLLAMVLMAALSLSACGEKEQWQSVETGAESAAQDAAGEAAFELSENGKAFLEKMCLYMPEFSDRNGLTEEFWEEFLFNSYTSLNADGAELVRVWREELELEEEEVKVSEASVDSYMKLALGVDWPGYRTSFEDMAEGRTALYYQDGYYYIGGSDFPDFSYTFKDCTAAAEGCCLVEYAVQFEDDPDAGSIYFTILPEQNENGFVVVKKENDLRL